MTARILVVEDNEFNRVFMIHQLENLGYLTDIAVDASNALDMMSKSPYDLVFMDCMMPVMDGYSATAAIRQREGSSRHTAIVAMTANALDEDREKCLAAGMDDYLSKPIDLARLQAVLHRWLPDSASAARPRDGSAPVDEARLHLVSDGDAAGLRHLIAVYLKSTSDDISHLRQAVRAESVEEVHRIAHGCAGASESFGMTAIVGPLRDLVAMAKQGRLSDSAGPLVEEAGKEFGRMKSFLETKKDLYF
jgi:CheY-like chemotaxis protein/HPt (histidine-containing phosphotransfer) domain-containing protein